LINGVIRYLHTFVSPGEQISVSTYMASTTKKSSKKTKPRLRRPKVKTSLTEQAQTIAELRRQVAEFSQRENATSDVLRLIASSAKNLQQVLRVRLWGQG